MIVLFTLRLQPFNYYVRKIFRKTNISYPLIRTVRNVNFSENFANVMKDPFTQINIGVNDKPFASQ